MTIFSAILVAASVAAVSAEAAEQQYHEKVAADIFLKVVTPAMNEYDELTARKWHEKFVYKQQEHTGTSSPLAWSFLECSAARPSSPVLGSSAVQVDGLCSYLCKAADSACTYLCKKTPIFEKTCIAACSEVESKCVAACGEDTVVKPNENAVFAEFSEAVGEPCTMAMPTGSTEPFLIGRKQKQLMTCGTNGFCCKEGTRYGGADCKGAGTTAQDEATRLGVAVTSIRACCHMNPNTPYVPEHVTLANEAGTEYYHQKCTGHFNDNGLDPNPQPSPLN